MYQQFPIILAFYDSAYVCPVIIPTGNDQITDASQYINVFPNPANDLLNIESENYPIESVELLTILGQTLLQLNNVRKTSVQLSVKDLPKGVYILKLQSGDEILSRKVKIADF